MLVGGITVDPNWFIQLILTLFVIAFGVLHVVKSTASRYFEVEANFDHRDHRPISTTAMESDRPSCANCGNDATKRCSGCKSVRYCSGGCQQEHWWSGHKSKCKVRSSSSTVKARSHSGISLILSSGSSAAVKKPRKILFPYEEFVELFNWDKAGFVPCGLLNCGNSCYANVVLQCLTSTRPLVAYLLDKGHRRYCRRNDWCFLCELETHVERASQSVQPFSPINILSRLPNIGGNLGYGRQEDAHEFMRFSIDTMQSVCLDEFGGEKAIDPSSQETTLIQHIFGGQLQSQVMCTKCNKISNQYENMMDLTVEIHGDASSLEECFDQFTMKEWLVGDNMYKCDGCNDYVKAWKRLTVRQPPNILTIALKRFQSGRFGKLNKKVGFPETFSLTPYMSEENDGINKYRLYAVVVHVDMLNASYFGHYICYIKDFDGNWYRIDDCKVTSIELEEVLAQPAYMLLYSRVSARPTGLRVAQIHGNGNGQSIRVSSGPGASLQDGGMNCISAVDSLHNDTLESARKDEGNNEMSDSVIVKQDSEFMDMDAGIPSSTDLKGASRCDDISSGVDSSVPLSETPENEPTFKEEDSHVVAVGFVTTELPRNQDLKEMYVDVVTPSSIDCKSDALSAVHVSETLENEQTSIEDLHVAVGFVTEELQTKLESRTAAATDTGTT